MSLETIFPSVECIEETNKNVYIYAYNQADFQKLYHLLDFYNKVDYAADLPERIISVPEESMLSVEALIKEKLPDIEYNIYTREELIEDNDDWVLTTTHLNFKFFHSTSFFKLFNTFEDASGFVHYLEDEINKHCENTMFIPDHFLAFQFPSGQEYIDAAFLNWYKLVPSLNEIGRQVNLPWYRKSLDAIDEHSVHYTEGICNLQFLYKFCQYLMEYDREYNLSLNELVLLKNMIDVLYKYKEQSGRLCHWLHVWEEEIASLNELVSVAIKQYHKRTKQLLEN